MSMWLLILCRSRILCTLQIKLGLAHWKHGWTQPSTQKSWNSRGAQFWPAKANHTCVIPPSRSSSNRLFWTLQWLGPSSKISVSSNMMGFVRFDDMPCFSKCADSMERTSRRVRSRSSDNPAADRQQGAVASDLLLPVTQKNLSKSLPPLSDSQAGVSCHCC